MNLINKIFLLVKKIFHKKENKMIEASTYKPEKCEKLQFKESLKIKENKKNNRIEILQCEGDGLGIQNKILY